MYVWMYVCMYVSMYVWMYVCMHACMHACKYMIVYFYLCIYAYIILTLFYLIGYLLFLHDLQCVMELYVTPASGGLRLFRLSSSSHQRWSRLQVRKVCGAARRRLGMFATFGRDKEFAAAVGVPSCFAMFTCSVLWCPTG